MKLAKLLEKELDLSSIKDKPIGFSFEEVYILEHGYLNKDVVLKMSSRHEVYEEGENLKWLKDKISVPEVYFNIYEDGMYYLVMEKCEHRMFQEAFPILGIKETLVLFGKIVREFHSIDIQGLPYNHDLEHKLEHVRDNIKKGLVRTQFFEKELQGKTGEELYRRMMEIYPTSFDLVLCHGDLSMPNIIINDDKTCSFIDVMGMGILDRHLDLAIAYRTISYNILALNKAFEAKYMEWFNEGYGKEDVDLSKIEFYILLDELTNG